ncbi:MAG: hypothetical protein GC179_23405 [Anaerolineaceae bacterium]|nr:hypothetical protein [Anaerolineaceae bacterium]
MGLEFNVLMVLIGKGLKMQQPSFVQPFNASNDDDQIRAELQSAQETAKSLNADDLKNGDWFLQILRMTISSYDRNARAVYFLQKYPGIHPDEIADRLISLATRYATLAGGIAGAAITANEIAALSTFGATIALFVTTVGAEMIYLARLQMRLILDLSVVYDIQLDADDPEDMMVIMYYALGIVPTDIVGKGIAKTAVEGSQTLIKTYISKDTLKSLQTAGRQVGMKILQRDILKLAVPVVSTAVGGTYNYITTIGVGKTAKSHFKNRNGVSDELRRLISRQNIYDLVFPAAVMYMANVDGKYSVEEKQFYKAIVSRMSFSPYEQAEFDQLIKHESSVMDAISKITDNDSKYLLVELLSMMATYDGDLTSSERDFLNKVSSQLNVPIDFTKLETALDKFRSDARSSIFQQSIISVRSSISKLLKRRASEVDDE